MAVPTVFAEAMSGDQHLLRVRGYVESDELFERLQRAARRDIEAATWMRAQAETTTGNVIVRLHCRVEGIPFDLGFHLEHDKRGRDQANAIRRAEDAKRVEVELLLDADAEDVHRGRLLLSATRLVDTARVVAALDAVL